MVRVPLTAGSSMTFRPLISWIKRKKSRRSTSFRFTEIGSPVYLPTATGGAEAWDCWDCAEEAASLLAAAFDAWAACCAASCSVAGRAGSFFPLNVARVNEGWVSSPGKAKRGAGIFNEFDGFAVERGGAALYSNPACDFGSCCKVMVWGFEGAALGASGCASIRTTTAVPSCEI